jgi:hypothetical protein
MKRRAILAVLAALPALALLAGLAAAQAGSLDLAWFTVDGGGGHSSGGAFTLSGTIGQPDAGRLTGGSFALDGGFWASAAPNYRLYVPVIAR